MGPVRPSTASPRSTEETGRVLGARYRLLRLIGRGASAAVYEADDVTLRRRVAVKLLHPALSADAPFLRRFRAEAQLVASLRHPHVLAVYDWGEDDGDPFLVTEYLSGGSVRDLLDAGHRASPAQVARLGIEAAGALDHAHRRGLVHRDVKPANLLLDDEGLLRVADFGVARALADASLTEPIGAVLGTARYASPEQVQGELLDGRSDVYSLALVLVEMATGRVPFAADTTTATLLARVNHRLEAPPELGPLGPVVEHAADPDRDRRLDAIGLMRGLTEAAAGLEPPAPLPLAEGASPADPDVPPDERTTIVPLRVLGRPARLFDGESDPELPFARGTNGATKVTVASPDDGPAPVSTAQPGPVGDTPAARSRLHLRGRWLAVAAAVLVLLAAVAVIVRAEPWLPSHTVPAVTGQTVEQAKAALAPLHLGLRSTTDFDEQAAAGRVARQTPAAGRSLKQDHAVHVVVSKGPRPRDVPDLKGTTFAQAQARLQAAGLGVKPDEEYDETAPAGQVLDWAPKGTQPRDTAITVRYSKGPAPRSVPSVTGQTYDQAAALLTQNGFNPSRGPDQFNDTVPKGQVVGTNPPALTAVDRGAAVQILVSKGPDLVTVPKLVLLSPGAAAAVARANGVAIAAVYGPPGATQVVLQSVPPGTQVKRGSPITIYTA